MTWILFVCLVWALNMFCNGQLLMKEDYRLSQSGYHLCKSNETRILSYTVQYLVPYTITQQCGGWIPWKTCQITKYRPTQVTEYKTVTEQVIRCCDGYTQIGHYCALTEDRSREISAKPGSCPSADGLYGSKGCEWDMDCLGWQKCCQTSSCFDCADPTSSGSFDPGLLQFNATVTIKVDYQELMSREGGLHNHTRLLYAMVIGALESNVSIRYLSSQPVHPYRTATSLMIRCKLSPSLNNVTSMLHRLLKHVQEVSSVTVKDIDECALPFLHRCSPHASCVNTFGLYYCTCRPGYTDVDSTNPGTNCTALSTLPPNITCFPPMTTTTLSGMTCAPTVSYTSETSTPSTTCPLPRIADLRAANVTSTSFRIHWSSQFPGNQSYRVALSKGAKVIVLNDTSQTIVEMSGLQAGVLYVVTVTPYACGRQGSGLQLTIKTDAQTLDATARLTNVNYTGDLQNASSTSYLNLTASIYMEIYRSLSPEMRALVDAGRVRIEITGFAPGSVVVSFTLVFILTQGEDINNVSLALINSLMNSSKYDVDANKTEINDRDECTSGENDCSLSATCANTQGSYTCACLVGFVDGDPERPGRSCQANTTTTLGATVSQTTIFNPTNQQTSVTSESTTQRVMPTTATTTSTATVAAPTMTTAAPTTTAPTTTTISAPSTTTTNTPTTTASLTTTTTESLTTTTASLTTMTAALTTTPTPSTTMTASSTTTAASLTTTPASSTIMPASLTTTPTPPTTMTASSTTTTASLTTTPASSTIMPASLTTTPTPPTTMTASSTTTAASLTTTPASSTIMPASLTTTPTPPTTMTASSTTTTASLTTTPASSTSMPASLTTTPTPPTTTTASPTTTTASLTIMPASLTTTPASSTSMPASLMTTPALPTTMTASPTTTTASLTTTTASLTIMPATLTTTLAPTTLTASPPTTTASLTTTPASSTIMPASLTTTPAPTTLTASATTTTASLTTTPASLTIMPSSMTTTPAPTTLTASLTTTTASLTSLTTTTASLTTTSASLTIMPASLTTTPAPPTTLTASPTTTTASLTTTPASSTIMPASLTTTAAPTTLTASPTTTTASLTTIAASSTTTPASPTTTKAFLTTTPAPPTTTTASSTTSLTTTTTSLTTTAASLTTTVASLTTSTASSTTTTASTTIPPLTITTVTTTTATAAMATTTTSPTSFSTAASTTFIATAASSTTKTADPATAQPATTTTARQIVPFVVKTINISASEAIAVKCNLASITVTVARDFLQSSYITEAALHLGMAECGVNGGNATHAQLTVAWDDCNTLLKHVNDSYYTVSVTLFNSINSSNKIQAPKIKLEIPVICTYNKSSLITSDFGSMGYDTIKDVITGSGMFQVIVQLMNGTVPLPHNFSLSPSESVMVVVSLNTSVDKIKVVINKCWATPTANPSLLSRYIFMENRCSINPFTTVITNGNSSSSSLSVQIFSFVDLRIIYLHCQVEICVELDSASCAPDCVQRTSRSGSRSTVGRALATSGPLFLQEDDPFEEGYDTASLIGLSCLGVGLTIFFIIGFVCLFYYQRNRIGHYNFNSNNRPKEENFTVLTLSA